MRSVLISLILVLMVVGLAGAEIPQIINYQGRVTDSDSNALPDNTYQVVFTIYNSADAATGVWSSGVQDVLIINGLFNYQLGSNNPLSDTMFADSSRWLGIQVIDDSEISPRTQLSSVPYAYHALRANSADHARSADTAAISLNSCIGYGM